MTLDLVPVAVTAAFLGTSTWMIVKALNGGPVTTTDDFRYKFMLKDEWRNRLSGLLLAAGIVLGFVITSNVSWLLSMGWTAFWCFRFSKMLRSF